MKAAMVGCCSGVAGLEAALPLGGLVLVLVLVLPVHVHSTLSSVCGCSPAPLLHLGMQCRVVSLTFAMGMSGVHGNVTTYAMRCGCAVVGGNSVGCWGTLFTLFTRALTLHNAGVHSTTSKSVAVAAMHAAAMLALSGREGCRSACSTPCSTQRACAASRRRGAYCWPGTCDVRAVDAPAVRQQKQNGQQQNPGLVSWVRAWVCTQPYGRPVRRSA